MTIRSWTAPRSRVWSAHARAKTEGAHIHNIVFCVVDLGEGIPSPVVRFAMLPGADNTNSCMTDWTFVVCALLDGATIAVGATIAARVTIAAGATAGLGCLI
jgi:hypothetical protein